ncbi:MAG: hypothetical protein QW353_01085 [Candidatus Korarchaeum sp.]
MLDQVLRNFEQRAEEAERANWEYQLKRVKWWTLNNSSLFWEQILNRIFEFEVYREVTIGEKDEPFSPWRVYQTREEFEAALKEAFKGGPRGVFVGVNRLREDGDCVLTDMALDLDWKENRNKDEVLRGLQFLNNFLESKGIYVRWVLSGGGLHGYLSTASLVSRFNEVFKEPWRNFRSLVELLEEYSKRKGFNICFDKQIYRSRGVIRAIYSPHRSGVVLYPLRSLNDLKSAKTKAIAPWIQKPEPPSWGYITRVDEFLRLIEIARENLDIHPVERRSPVSFGGVRSMDIGGVRMTYPSELEGYGWIKFIIENRIYLADGRQVLIWKALGPAISHDLIALADAEAYLRGCLTQYPDPKKPIEYYIKKLRYNAKSKANPPTWRTLVLLKGKMGDLKDPEGLSHLREKVLEALRGHAVVRE